MISRYKYHDLTWVDVESPTHEDIRQIMDEFDVHPIVADELLGPSLRPRVDSYPNFIYLILHFPSISHKHNGGCEQEIDFIKDIFEDRILSKDDKKAIDETLKAEKVGKLKSMKEVFG